MPELIDLISSNFDYDNFFSAKLTAPMTASDTDVFLDTIPTPSEGVLVIDWDVAASREIIFYNSKTASKVVCPSVANGRGFDDTSATTHLSGANVIMAPVRAWFRLAQQLATTSTAAWKALGYTPNTITNNGARDFDLVFNSVNLSTFLSPGMKVKLTRTVTAPTQCTDLEASSTQYWSDTSLTGFSFTDDITVMAWVKVESYNGHIISNRTASNGFDLYMYSDGTVRVHGLIDGSNYKLYRTYNSLPVGKWVHVAATMNMSANTSEIYFDGVLQDQYTQNSGVANSFTLATSLFVGASVGGATPFDGKIAQAAIFSSVLSAATIRQYMTYGLSGSESTLVSAYSFNGTANDLNTTNANNLSASGSATATNSDSPFTQGTRTIETAGTTEYGIVTDVTYSTNTTVGITVPEGSQIPTSGGISAVSYSTEKAPYGFPLPQHFGVGNTSHQEVATAETTTSTSSSGADLSTYGPYVVVWVGPSGVVELDHASVLKNSGVAFTQTTVRRGNNSVGPVPYLSGVNTNESTGGRSMKVTGLAQGWHTFVAKYYVGGGTGTYSNRSISAAYLDNGILS